MSWLALLLIIKIAVTALLVALPFLFAPLEKLEKTIRVSAQNPLFFRLYGVAITALLVGYAFGVPVAERGQFPWGVTSMGLVSNAGAAFLLLRANKPRSHGFGLGAFFALIAVGLTLSMALPREALLSAW